MFVTELRPELFHPFPFEIELFCNLPKGAYKESFEVCVKGALISDTLFFYIRISFIRISRLKFKNKAEAEILKRIDIILCVETSVNTIQFYVFNLTV